MPADHQDQFDTLLGHLYDSVLAPTGFQSFIEAMCGHFRLKGVLLNIRHAETLEMKGLWWCGTSPEWLEKYAREFAKEDILAQHIARSPIAHFYASNLDLPEPERFPEIRFYREWVAPQGMAYAAGGIVLREGAWDTEMYLQRSSAQGAFSREELEQFNRLVPHMQRAIQMRQRLADLQLGREFLASGLDVLAMPTFLFNEASRVAHMNRNAEALLGKDDSLRLQDGHLLARDPLAMRNLNYELSQAIRSSRSGAAEVNGVILLPRAGRMPLMLMLSPLRMAGGTSLRGAALLFAFDPENTPRMTTDLVRRLFGLSEAEAGLAVALCGGRTLEETAAERGTSIHTIRTQLKSVFAKTGTRRQADLVSMLLASPAYFLAPAGDQELLDYPDRHAQ